MMEERGFMNDSIKLAKMWTELEAVKDKIDNYILPVGGHLGIEDSELMQALEQLSDKIETHFQGFKLVAETTKQKTV